MTGVAAASPLAAVIGTGTHAAAATTHEVYDVPPSGVFTLHGRGFGHGHGMSQWGALGAASVDKLSAAKILRFYYPHTTSGSESSAQQIRVLLSAVDAPGTGYVEVRPAGGLTASYAGASHVLATRVAHPGKNGKPGKAHAIGAWRVQRAGDHLALRERDAKVWHTAVANVGTNARFSDDAAVIPVGVPGGGASIHFTSYRGTVAAELRGSLEAVNRLPMQAYLLSVVPAEMPASWPQAALRAQAVAARTYAAHGINHPKAGWYDVDGDTRDQAYAGVPGESSASTIAVRKTAGKVLLSGGAPIFAQFGAADGGWTASGGEPYLPERKDPFDGAVPNDAHAWMVTLPAANVRAEFPSLGRLRAIEVNQRDGHGLWGGRIVSLTLVGTKANVALSGESAEFDFGLRSTWWRPEPTPAAPRHVAAQRQGQTVAVRWQPPRHVFGEAPVNGYRVTLLPGKQHRTVSVNARSVTFRHVPAADASRVRIVATSRSGPGPRASARVTAA